MPVEDPQEWPADAGAPEDGPATVPGPAPFDRPAPVSTPGANVQEPHRGGDEEKNEPDQQEVEFDSKHREAFEGLMYLGRLTDSFTLYGHNFVIRTLLTGEILEIGLLAKPYRDTLGDIKAYQAAVVAACMELVDDRPLVIPLTNEPLDTSMRAKFQYVLRHWFPPILNGIYEQYLILEQQAEQVLNAMGKASR